MTHIQKDHFYRCGFYIQGKQFDLTIHSALKFYNYGRDYTHQDFYYKHVESTCGKNIPMISLGSNNDQREAHDIDDEEYVYSIPNVGVTVSYMDYLGIFSPHNLRYKHVVVLYTKL